MADRKRKIYWDSCCFLGLINRENDKHDDCRAVWQEVEAGRSTLFTSFLTFAEVFKAKCEAPARPLAEGDEDVITQFLRQDVANGVLLDERVAVLARRLLRRHPECKKPNDGLHLASAIIMDVDEMHTYDGADLIPLSEQVRTASGRPLVIAKPKPVPRPPLPLFDQSEDGIVPPTGAEAADPHAG